MNDASNNPSSSDRHAPDGDASVGLDLFAASLSQLSLRQPGPMLQDRLKAAIRSAEESLVADQASRIVIPAEFSRYSLSPSNGRSSILEHFFLDFPVVQWTAAAAALVFALVVAFESTKSDPTSPSARLSVVENGFTSSETNATAARPIYRIVDGRLVPTDGSSPLIRASYRGIRVIDGKAYRHFQNGERDYIEPVIFEAAGMPAAK